MKNKGTVASSSQGLTSISDNKKDDPVVNDIQIDDENTKENEETAAVEGNQSKLRL